MSRQVSIARRELSAAREAARRFDVMMEDGKADPHELEWVEDGIEECVDVADRTDVCLSLVGTAIETSMEGRRFRESFGRFTLIQGGLAPELGPGVA
jgi:hypothetical protein